ncbi:hypothetical protein HN630_02065 [archaeon]|nr:hypothetical protein [archaeon]MBT6956208.1 hypothetical protein [archaeon]MBT7567664.1 hypothetical protein [archaeon]
MDYGGVDRRRTKKDLKRKRLARGYKRGGKFRTAEVNDGEIKSEKVVGKKGKKKGKKK